MTEPDDPSPAEFPRQAPAPGEPKPGDDVVYRGLRARVVMVHPPAGPDAAVDLVAYRGPSPEAFARVPHDLASGWYWAEEVPPPPPTLEQKLADLRKAGVRLPRVGDEVLEVRSTGVGHHEFPYVAQRARVVEVQAVEGGRVLIALSLFEQAEKPADPLVPDPVRREVYGGQRGPVGPGERSQGWAWPGWELPPHLTEEERLPKSPCGRCGKPWPHQRRVPLRVDAEFRGRKFSASPYSSPAAWLCGPCIEAVLEFATTPPAAPAA